MKKTLSKLNLSLLSKYDKFSEANPNNWDIVSYLNTFYETNAALAFSKFFFPDFVEVRGCIILGFLYNKKIFEDWFKSYKGDIAGIECMCNLYELKDYFHINDDYDDDTIYWERIFALGHTLQRAWQINLKLLFPDRKFKVDLVDDRKMDMYYITIYSIPERKKREKKEKMMDI